MDENTGDGLIENVNPVKEKISYYSYAAWAAIIGAVLIIPAFIIGFLSAGYGADSVPLRMAMEIMILTIIGFITAIIILIGFIKLAKRTNNQFLKIMAIIAIVMVTISNLLFLFFPEPIMSLILLILTGITEIILGISFLKLKEQFGKVATALGVMYIVNGSFIVSILFILLMPLTSLAISILEAIIFFRASKLLK